MYHKIVCSTADNEHAQQLIIIEEFIFRIMFRRTNFNLFNFKQINANEFRNFTNIIVLKNICDNNKYSFLY